MSVWWAPGNQFSTVAVVPSGQDAFFTPSSTASLDSRWGGGMSVLCEQQLPLPRGLGALRLTKSRGGGGRATSNTNTNKKKRSEGD